MVPSSTLTVSTDGECWICGGFSLGETVCLGSFESIIDYFSDLSLSPRRSYSGTTFMGPTSSRSPSLQRAMIEDSTKEFHTMSSEEKGSSIPSPRRHGTGILPAPVTTTPWMENTLTTQAMMTVPPWTVAQ
jgi:hypothetical protein